MYIADENMSVVAEVLQKRFEKLCSLPPEEAKAEGKRMLVKLGLIDENCNYLVAFVPRNTNV